MKKIKHINLYLLGLIIVSIAVFLPSVTGEFLNWDDTTYISENPLIYKDISFSSFKDLYEFNRYISLVLFSFLVQVNLFGNHPELFHIINIFIHAINVILIFKLTSFLLSSHKKALIIALLFAIFPTKAESVCWIAQRKDLLFSMFFLIGALSYLKFLKGENILWLFITIISSYLSVMCKLQALAIIPTLLLLEYFIKDKIQYKSWILITGIFLIMLIKTDHAIDIILFIILPLLIGFYHDKLNKLFSFITFKIRLKKRKYTIRITDLIFYYYFCSIGGSIVYKFLTGAVFQDFSSESFYILLQLNAIFIIYVLYYKPAFHINKNRIKFYLIILTIGILTAGIIFFYSDKMLQDGWGLFKSNNVFFPFYSFNYYLYRFIFPFNLNAMIPYPESITSLLLIYKLSPIISILLVFISVTALRKLKNQSLKKNIVFGFLFFVFNIAIVLHVVPIKGKVIVADRYTYLAYYGLIFSLVCFLYYLYNRLKHKITKRAFHVFSISVILLLSLQTYSRSYIYLNDKTFWNDIIAKDKENDYAWYSLGLYYFNQGNFKKAIRHYNTAIALNEDNYEYYANRGGTYYKMQYYEKALADFNKAISLNPESHTAYNNRGALYLKTGKPTQALNDFLKAISLMPDYPEALKNLEETKKLLYPDKNQTNKTDKNKALSDYYNSMGIEYAMKNDMKTALEFFNKAIAHNKTNTKALKNRGNAYASLERLTEARADYLKVLEITPNDAGIMMNIGNILHQKGNTKQACRYWKKAFDHGYKDAKIMMEKYCSK